MCCRTKSRETGHLGVAVPIAVSLKLTPDVRLSHRSWPLLPYPHHGAVGEAMWARLNVAGARHPSGR